jgi:hypothetical protein
MSWASKRETTRLEDQAYSLLGIFGVHMPLLYGEGEIAFFRLQQQITGNSDDESIFAWVCDEAPDDKPFGMLAESPLDFRRSGQVEPTKKALDGRTAFGWKSGSLELSRGFTHRKGLIRHQGLVALACKRRLKGRSVSEEHTVAIWLRRIEGVGYRFFCRKFYYTTEEPYSNGHQTFYIPQPNLETTPRLQYDGHEDPITMIRDRVREGEVRLTNAMAEKAGAEARRQVAETQREYAEAHRVRTEEKQRKIETVVNLVHGRVNKLMGTAMLGFVTYSIARKALEKRKT